MNATEYVQHTAVLREAQLAAGLIGSGVTALGKATHSTVGRYHEAFFGLSIGIERLCKLLYIADYAIEHEGTFPSFDRLKNQGHDLDGLLNTCEEIGGRVDATRPFCERPSTAIHQGIVHVLSDFATSTRYYNLDYLTKPSTQHVDPVAAWWSEVGEPICELHYSGKNRQRDEMQAAIMGADLGKISTVVHTTETGEPINTVSELMKRNGSNIVVQKYGRLYTLQIVRWLALIAFQLSHTGGYERRIAGLFCFHEPLTMFHNEDRYLRERKTWPLYR